MPNKENKINNVEKVEKKVEFKEILEKIKVFSIKNSVPQYLIIGIALFFLSMMFTAQMKSISNTEEVLAGKRESELADELVNLQRNYSDLKEKYDSSQKVVEEYKNDSASNNTLISSMKEENEMFGLLAGATNLKGEGVVVTLSDGTTTDTIVHDSDVLTVVNELKAAGAEAISVNGQRIISTSAIRCVGPVIQVNYQKVAAPFEIKAIGKAEYLESALNIKNGIVDMLKGLGVGVTTSRSSEVKIPKYEGSLTFSIASEYK